MAQLPKSKQKKLAFTFCKAVCLGRIRELRRLNEKRKSKELCNAIKKMTELERQLKKSYKDGQVLKAVEGNIAKHFFSGIRFLLPSEAGFLSRDRKAGDLFNVLLNCSHGLLRARVSRALSGLGLNTSFGFLHFQEGKNKPFLVWDFAEFWVPRVDKLCFYAVNKRIFSEKHLVKAKSGGGRWLNASGWRVLRRLFDARVSGDSIVFKADQFRLFLDGKSRFSWKV